MKITCPSCSARYSIDDAKVKGKAFKFTCKKCGQTHVYRSTSDGAAAVSSGAAAASSAPAAAPRAGGGYEEEAVWYVAVGEEQQGPYTTQQIREYAQTDQLDPESYLWKEGMEDWLPVQQIPEFADLTLGGGAAGSGAAAPPPADSPFGGMPDDVTVASPFTAAPPAGGAGDLFSFGAGPQASAKSESSPFDAFGAGGGSAAVASRGGADVFAPAQPSPFDQTEDREQDVMMGAAAAAPSPRVDAARMIGQRNENSVLFSLASLQALAAGRSGAAGAGPKAGFASGEGSGLIDIRAMASTTAPREEKPEDLFALGGGGAIGAPVAVPILTRPIRHDDESRKPMYILIGVIGAFAIAIVVLLILLLRGGEKQVIVQTVPSIAGADGGTIVAATAGGPGADAGAKEEPDTAAAKVEEDKGGGGDVAEAGGAGEPNAKAADGGDGTGGGNQEPPASPGSGRRRGGGRSPAGGGTAGTGPVPASAATTPTGGRDTGSSGQTRSGGRLAGDLSALGINPTRRDTGSSSSSSGSSGAGANLPPTPDREAVRAKFESVRGAVRACTGGQAGTAQAQTTIQGSTGRVTRVNVTGDFTGPAATCITNAIRGLTFPPFANPTLTVNYSYRF